MMRTVIAMTMPVDTHKKPLFSKLITNTATGTKMVRLSTKNEKNTNHKGKTKRAALHSLHSNSLLTAELEIHFSS